MYFFKTTGPVIISAVPSGKSIDHKYFIKECLKPVVKVINDQRPKSGTNGVKLHFDNARPHKTKEVESYLKSQAINLVPQPTYLIMNI